MTTAASVRRIYNRTMTLGKLLCKPKLAAEAQGASLKSHSKFASEEISFSCILYEL